MKPQDDAPPHVLIVDDEPDVRELLEAFLRCEGYSTQSACNGLEALARLQERTPCVIVLDLMMPIMSGWEFREAQLANPAIADVPVLCVSAVYDRREVAERLDLPCVGKPVNLDELAVAVREACDGNNRANGHHE